MDNDIEFKLQNYRVNKTFNNRLPNDTEFDFAGVAEDTVYENFYDRYSVIHGISPRFTQNKYKIGARSSSHKKIYRRFET